MTVPALLILAGLAVLIGWLLCRPTSAEAYDIAMRKDLEYARSHPDCTYEEAHRNRDRVYRRRGL